MNKDSYFTEGEIWGVNWTHIAVEYFSRYFGCLVRHFDFTFLFATHNCIQLTYTDLIHFNMSDISSISAFVVCLGSKPLINVQNKRNPTTIT